jgi:hypothetical protein
MKFLAFNLLAAVALIYLFSGAHAPSVENALERASETAQTLIDKGREVVSGKVQAPEIETPEPAVEPEQRSAPVAVASGNPKVVAEPKPEAKPKVSGAPAVPVAPAPTIAELAKLLPVDQAVAKRRAEVMAAAVPAAAGPAAQVPESAKKQVFMSREERQRELHQLAQEMELMFVDKVVK